MKRDWFYIFSPGVIVLIFMFIVGMIYSIQAGGWWIMLFMLTLAYFAVPAVADIFFKLIIRKNAKLLWLVECIVLVLWFFFGLDDFATGIFHRVF